MTSPTSNFQANTSTNLNRSPSFESDNRSSFEHQKTAVAAVEWGLQHEYQIKELEVRLIYL